MYKNKDLGFITIGLGTEFERKIKIKNISAVIIPNKKTIRFSVLENNEGYVIQSDNLENPETSFHHWIGQETLACIVSSLFLAQQNNAIDIDYLLNSLPSETECGFIED